MSACAWRCPCPQARDTRHTHRHTQRDTDTENKCGKANGGAGVTGISLQLNGRFGPGLDMLLRKLAGHKRAMSSQQRRRTTTARVTKTSEHGAGEVHHRDSPLGHRAQILERNVVRTGPVSFLFAVWDRTTDTDTVTVTGTDTDTRDCTRARAHAHTRTHAHTHTRTRARAHKHTHTHAHTQEKTTQRTNHTQKTHNKRKTPRKHNALRDPIFTESARKGEAANNIEPVFELNSFCFCLPRGTTVLTT